MLDNRVTRLITSVVEAVVILFASVMVGTFFFEDLTTHLGMLALTVCVVHLVNQILYDVLNFDSLNESMGGRIFKRVVFFVVLALATLFEFLCIEQIEPLKLDSSDWFLLGIANASVFGGTLMAGYYMIATTLQWDQEDTVFSPAYIIGAAYVLGFITSILGAWIPFMHEHGLTVMLGLLNIAMLLYMIFVSLPYSEDAVVL